MNTLFAAGLVCTGVACAGAAGLSLWHTFERWRYRVRYRQKVRNDADENIGTAAVPIAKTSNPDAARKSRLGSFDTWIVERTILVSRMLALGHRVRLMPVRNISSKWLAEHANLAGIADEVSAEGFWEMRVRAALVCALIGALIGVMFSTELMVLLAVIGLVLGLRIVPWALKRRIQWRVQEMERHLPEMLDVVSLGMRSGLSFDRSLELYVQHFDTLLSEAFDLARRQWSCGLVRRDDALRNIADSYDSTIFGRVVESIIRSLRFGSSMIEGLEAAAGEARASCRAHREEQVAKAPVKMMIPTGVLILPAMLILVLGPVILEMVGGFV